MVDCSILPHMVYKARVELKKKYFSPERSVKAPIKDTFPKMSMADFLGVFMVFSILICIGTIVFAFEFSLKRVNH